MIYRQYHNRLLSGSRVIGPMGVRVSPGGPNLPTSTGSSPVSETIEVV